MRVILATTPSQRADLWPQEVTRLAIAGDAGIALNYPHVTEPSDHDIALALIAYRTGLSMRETLAVRDGHLHPDGLATLAALIDPALGPWTAHLTAASDHASPSSQHHPNRRS